MFLNRFNRVIIFGTLFLNVHPLLANESGAIHHSSPLDLLFPFINVIGLFVILHLAARKSIENTMVERSQKIQQSKAQFETKKRTLEADFAKLESLEKGFALRKELRIKDVQKMAVVEKEKLEKDIKIQEERIKQETLGRVENFRLREVGDLVSQFLANKQESIAQKIKTNFTAEREIKYVEQYLKELK